ncbi:hypothetical protein DBY21_07460 [Candidatus Gastranaerophilales bacterium]|nr:MAG: hypothetical protein DBY21_07460 [Candidatus Gastranaerophilales bacterium]
MKKQHSFTLAEVLITLGIIGIVAAMTLPSVIDKSQKFILRQQFKKAYSILSQALLKSEADLGYSPLCYYNAKQSVSSSDGYLGGSISTECSILRDVMLKNLSVIQKCENNAFVNHCIPEYIGLEKVYMQNDPNLSEEEANNKIKSYSGWSTSNILNTNPAYVLKDGTIIIANSSTGFPRNFAVDINGKKGPNRWGYDLFPIILVANSNTNLILQGYGGYPVENGGISAPEMVRQMYK